MEALGSGSKEELLKPTEGAPKGSGVGVLEFGRGRLLSVTSAAAALLSTGGER